MSSSKILDALRALVQDTPGVTLGEVLTPETLQMIDGATSDDIYKHIARRDVYVNLREEALAEPDLVHLYLDEETADAYRLVRTSERLLDSPQTVLVEVGVKVTWDGQLWEIANVGKTEMSLEHKESKQIRAIGHEQFRALVFEGKITGIPSPEKNETATKAHEILKRASPEAQRIAIDRYNKIKPYLDGHEPDQGTTPARTRRDWMKKYRDAERTYGNGFIGLLPRTNESGNFEPKLPEATRELMQEIIEKSYQTPTRKHKTRVYGQLVNACTKVGLTAPSFPTFSKAVDMQDTYKQTAAREGTRAAYGDKPAARSIRRNTPVHGDRPMEIAHMDHTEFDEELRDSKTGDNLGRCWGTTMIDAFSRSALAVYVSYNPPSASACMMTLRECVRRFGRLPETIVMDNGKEFSSTEVEMALAWLGVAKKLRPPAEPRFGSPEERFFGTINSQFVHNLRGNTQNTKNPRQLTDDVDPKRHAVWTLERFYVRLREYAYEIYDTTDHPALGQSPREAFEQGLYRTGNRPFRLIPYDETFIMLTMPTTNSGKAKVQPNLGVKIFGRYYWADIMRSPDVQNTSVDIKYDPDDAGIAYAYIKGTWVLCHSSHYHLFQGRSPRQIKIASEEYRKRNQLHGKNIKLSAARLDAWIETLEAEEVLLSHQLRDAENRKVNALVNQSLLPNSDVLETVLPKRSAVNTTTAIDLEYTSPEDANEVDDYFSDDVFGTYKDDDR